MEKLNSKKEKISLEIDKETLKAIDEFANLSKNNRKSIIEALIIYGLNPYLDYTESTWKKFLDNKRYEKNKEMQKSIKILLGDLEKFRSKHKWLSRENWKTHLKEEVGIEIKKINKD